MPKCGRKRKKRRTEKDEEMSEKDKMQTPRCFVIKRGAVGDRIKDLIQDFRMVMMPNCAQKLRESKNNRVEDFMAVAGHYGVSHLVMFTATKLGTYMKLAKLPQGPTLTFKVESFSLARNVKAMQRRPHSNSREFASAPLQVLNGFGAASGDKSREGTSKSGGAEKQLTMEMLRGMFPAIDVQTFNQAECRRVALFHYDKEKDSIHFRHFSVGRRQAGVHRGISRLLNTTRVPKLAGHDDVADLVLGEGGGSDSEMEDGSSMTGQVKIRLSEVGPRLELLLVKCEEGVQNGAVLFHRYLKRTPTEQEVLEQRARQRRKLKERNAKLEAENKTKKKKLQEIRKRKAEAKKKVDADEEGGGDASDSDAGADTGGDAGKKRKRFHPFAKGSKARTVSKDNTVEIDSKPSKQRNRRGGQRQRDGEDGDDARRPTGRKGGGKGKKGGGKGSGKRGGKDRVLDAFRKRQRR